MSAHTLGPLAFSLCLGMSLFIGVKEPEREIWVCVWGVCFPFSSCFPVCVCVYVECLTQNHNNLAIILEFSVTRKQLIPALPE